MATLRVASYNLRGLRDDTDAAARVVRAIDPDVLLVQEMPRHPLSSYRIAGFARACGLLWSGRGFRLGETTLMTNLRVIATDSQDRQLPVSGRIGTPQGILRSYSWSQVTVPGRTPVTVVSMHLPLVAEDRLAHVERVLADLWPGDAAPHTPSPSGGTTSDKGTSPDDRSADAASPDPVLEESTPRLVIGGDLNESVDGPAWSVLGERLRLATPDQPTFPAARPNRRIDAIFASTGLGVIDAAVAGAPELAEADLATATDHLPVWVDLEV